MSRDQLPEERERLLKIRQELGELKTEAKPFSLNENITIRQVYGSSAGAGSGTHHTYRKLKKIEEERLREMDREWEEKVAQLEFEKHVIAEQMALREQQEQRRLKRLRRAANRKKYKEQMKTELESIAQTGTSNQSSNTSQARDSSNSEGSSSEGEESNANAQEKNETETSGKEQAIVTSSEESSEERPRKPGIEATLAWNGATTAAESSSKSSDEAKKDDAVALAEAKAKLLAKLAALKGSQ